MICLDIKSKEARSKNMASIRSKNTKPEMYLRSILFRKKYRYRVNYKAIEGHPDIYFTRQKIAIFIHGCYWHRHEGCKYAYTPKSNSNFWLTKFDTNKRRDCVVYETLEKNGVRVLIVWECTIKKMKSNSEFYNRIITQIDDFIINRSTQFLEI